jgi:hypothetical protein
MFDVNGKRDPVIDAAHRSLARAVPGDGVNSPDDGQPGSQHIRIRAISHVSTARLLRRLGYLNHLLSPAGMHDFDGPRRALIHHGVHRKAIAHEINLRKGQGNA